MAEADCHPEGDGLDLGAFGFDDPQGRWLDRFQAASSAVRLGSIGPYEVLEEAGRGGQGVVYRARQPGMQRDVALKRLPNSFSTPDARKRFEREIQVVSRLNHPAIVTVFAMDVVEGQPLLAMEWVEGLAVTHWVRKQRCRRDQIIRTFVAVCDAVHHAHQHGVVHRDLKPSNILVDAGGRPHLLDFGLAKIQEPESTDDPTRTEHFMGTPAYASPEQVREQSSEIDIRTDVYSLGVILYEALTGHKPVPEQVPLVDLLQAIRETEPRRPSALDPTLDADLDAIVLKALCKEKEGRYQSMEALAADLRRHLAGHPVLAHPPGAWYSFRKLAARHRLPLAGALTAVLLIAGFAVVAGWSARAARSAREHERQARLVAERVGDFLSDTLASARPSRGGPDYTVLQALEEAGIRAQAELADHPQVAARVHYTIGETYRALWRRRDALPHLQRALALNRQIHEQDHEALARSLAALGSVYTNLHDNQAVDLQRQGLDMRCRMYGSADVRVADSMTRLAYALHQAQEPPRWDEAEVLFEQALALYRRLLGPQHRDVASCLHNLGWMRVRQRRLVEAAEVYEQALEVFRGLGDLQDPFYADCLYGYAAQLLKLGRYDESLPVLQETIPLIRRIYGRQAAAFLMWECGRAHLTLGHREDALQWHKQALEAVCARLAKEHPNEDSLRILANACATALQDRDAALPIDELLDALAVVEQPYRPAVVAALNHLAGLWIGLQQDKQAADLLDRQDAVLLARVGADSPLRVGGLRWRSVRQRRAGHTAQAAASLQEAMTIVTRHPLSQALRQAQLRSELGECLSLQQHFSEAEAHLLAGQPILEQELGEAHHETQTGMQRLVRLYESWGKVEQATFYRNQLKNETAR